METNPTTANIRAWDADATRQIEARLAATHSEPDREALTTHAQLLDRYLEASSVDVAVDLFLASQTAFEARADAFAAVATFRHLGVLTCEARTWPGWAAPSNGRAKRHFRPLEHALIRAVSLARPAAAVTVGFVEAGSGSGELAQPTALDLVHDDDGWAVDLPGTDKTSARRLRLGRWLDEAIPTLIAERPTGPLLYAGTSEDPAKRQSAILMAVGKVIAEAGLKGDRTVAPESIRNTAARTAYDLAPPQTALQTAADRLGLTNLDRVAGLIGLDTAPPPPPPVLWTPHL